MAARGVEAGDMRASRDRMAAQYVPHGSQTAMSSTRIDHRLKVTDDVPYRFAALQIDAR
jgi:hypothetical protein